MKKWPTYFIPHGGGPCFFMDTPPGIPSDTWDEMAAFLRGIDADLGERPKAVIVISAHWMTPNPAIVVEEHPALYFDYYNFPPHTYELTYPTTTPKWLVDRLDELLSSEGYQVDKVSGRGLDHGVFVPFKLVYPDADVPLVQLSMPASDDAEEHLKFGRALSALREEGVLIVGSGLSYHNLRDFYRTTDKPAAAPFDTWLNEAVMDTDARDDKLKTHQSAPGFTACHPTPEHLLPLMIAAGAAEGEAAEQVYSEVLLGAPNSGFRFG
ncbi:MAG: dioxygenase [Ponticaulis sp.]|nr:dioxygenase [Ponticaulis sp.]